MNGVRPIAKRGIDVIFSLTALLILLPVMAVVVVAIRLTMGRPVFFRQLRPGYRKKPFVLYKFRTMREAHNADGAPRPDAERLTRLGQLLRHTSLDELPQLWNVLRGDLSLVGPRPLLMHYLPLYTPEQARRHDVKPGITGWAQVNGRNAISWEDKFSYDVWYVEHWSLWLDLKILILTLIKVTRQTGISQAGQATMRNLLGPRAGHERDLQHPVHQCWPASIADPPFSPGAGCPQTTGQACAADVCGTAPARFVSDIFEEVPLLKVLTTSAD